MIIFTSPLVIKLNNLYNFNKNIIRNTSRGPTPLSIQEVKKRSVVLYNIQYTESSNL